MSRPNPAAKVVDVTAVRVGALINRNGQPAVTMAFTIMGADDAIFTFAIPLDVFDDIGVDASFFRSRAGELVGKPTS